MPLELPTAQLAIVTVTWNSVAHLESFAQSLAQGAGELPWELVIVDNASRDGTADAAATMAWPPGGSVSVLRSGSNLGYAGGLNTGLAHVDPGTVVVVVNPDVRFQPAALLHLYAACASGRADIAVPVQIDGAGKALPTLRREPTVRRAWGEAVLGGIRAGRHDVWGELVLDPEAYVEATEADWASGSVMCISPRARAELGPWDERFFLYSEETDFALRARDRGLTLRLVPEAQCRHLLGEAHDDPRLWALLTANRVRLFRRRNGAIRTAAFRAGLLLGSALRSVGTRRRAAHRAALVRLMTPSSRWRRAQDRLQANGTHGPRSADGALDVDVA